MIEHLATVGRKNAPLTGANLRHNQALGGAAICHGLLGGERREKRKFYDVQNGEEEMLGALWDVFQQPEPTAAQGRLLLLKLLYNLY